MNEIDKVLKTFTEEQLDAIAVISLGIKGEDIKGYDLDLKNIIHSMTDEQKEVMYIIVDNYQEADDFVQQSHQSEDEDELFHVGVKGMKWGVRRRKIQVPISSKSTGNRRMSNKELASRIKRLKLEKEFKELTTPPKVESKVQKAMKAASTVANMSDSAIKIYKNFNEMNKLINDKK